MKKRRLLALFAATAVLAGTMFAAGCNKDTDSDPAPSETYTGVVSTQSYDSQNDAVAACISTELSGEAVKVEMTKYEKDAELTEEEIQTLDISSEIDGTIESVEIGKAYYTEISSANAQAAADSESSVYITVYVIKYTPAGTQISQYKYLIPLPKEGETLSYSYLNSVLDAEKYKNCTMTYVNTTKASATGSTSTTKLSFTMAITEAQARIDYTMAVTGQSISYSIYMVESENTLKSVVDMFGQFYEFDLSDIGLYVDSISDLYSSKFTEAECAMFVKTNYGFKINDEIMSDFASSVIRAGMTSIGPVTGEITLNSPGRLEYRVVDGKLYKANGSFSGSATVRVQGSPTLVSMSAVEELRYTAYGTTTVTIPQEAKTLLGIN